MKCILPFLLATVLTCAASDLKLPDGTILKEIGEIKFDGAKFKIEHEGGIATVSWEQMPLAIRSQYSQDTGNAAREARMAEARKLGMWRLFGKVVSVTKAGIIMKAELSEAIKLGEQPFEGLCFVEMHSDGLYDDAPVDIKALRSGTYGYTAAGGGYYTVVNFIQIASK